MSVTTRTTHRVECTFDARAWELFGDTCEMRDDISRAAEDDCRGGYYPDGAVWVVWGEFSSYAAARRCDFKLREVAARWLKKAQEYDAAAT